MSGMGAPKEECRNDQHTGQHVGVGQEPGVWPAGGFGIRKKPLTDGIIPGTKGTTTHQLYAATPPTLSTFATLIRDALASATAKA